MSLPSDYIHSLLSAEDKAVADWYYNASRNGDVATFLFGMCIATAAQNPDLKFWDVLREAKRQFEMIPAR